MAKRLFLTAALAGLAVALMAQSPPPSPTERGEKKQDVSSIENTQPKPAYSPSPTTSPAFHQPASPPTQSDTTKKGGVSSTSSSINWALIFTVAYTALLLLFNGILAVVAIYQYKLTTKQSDLTEKGLIAAKDAAKAAQTSANAATDAVTHAKNAMAVTERAVILIESVVAKPQLAPNAPYGPSAPYFRNNSVLIFTLKNFGSTVAHEVKLGGYVHFCEGGRQIRDMPKAAIAPEGKNEWITSSLFLEEPIETLNSVNNTEGAIWYEAEITYKDVFTQQAHTYKAKGRYIPLLRSFIIISSTSD